MATWGLRRLTDLPMGHSSFWATTQVITRKKTPIKKLRSAIEEFIRAVYKGRMEKERSTC